MEFATLEFKNLASAMGVETECMYLISCSKLCFLLLRDYASCCVVKKRRVQVSIKEAAGLGFKEYLCTYIHTSNKVNLNLM